MVLPNPFQQLRDLDRASPQFHKQFVDFLRGDEYRNAVPNLQGEDLTWLVEYLDSVSHWTISPRLALSTDVGPHRHFRSFKRPVPGIAWRAQKDMQPQGGTTEIVHTSRQACQVVPKGRPAGG